MLDTTQNAVFNILKCSAVFMIVLQLSNGCPTACFCNTTSKLVHCHDSTMVGIPSTIPMDTKYLSVLGTPSSRFSQVLQLTRSHFSSMKNLLELHITYADISTINGDTFQDLSSIREISLPNNKIKTIPKGLFQNLPELAYIDLSGNFDCIVEMGGLSQIPSLQYLYAGNINLGSLDPGMFQGLPSLKGLYIPGNGLTSIDRDVLLPLTNLKVLNIMENNIASLTPDLEPLLSNLESLFISDNPWQCTCENKWMKSLSSVSSVHVDSIVICLGPDKFKYQNLNTIPDSELKCIPPNITCSGPFTVYIGDSLTIECHVEGDPTPTVVFENPNQVNISKDTPVLGYTLQNDNTIVIQSVVEAEDGNWTVSATNSKGEDFDTVHVTVIPPSTTTVSASSSEGADMDTAHVTVIPPSTTTVSSVSHVHTASVDNTGIIIGAVAGAITLIAAVAIFTFAVYKKYMKNKVEPFRDDEEDLFGVTVHRIEGHSAPISTAWI
ncbi:leucine-rich repeat-containing protein 4B-like [Haliotis asinina]|uniref:leucine-rich repeat-containing protein 4B-like n=1 Tax=Haliotis asinina TaxID=109174 RepID=UPI003532771B